MKSEAAVRRKLRQVLFRHLKQELALRLQKKPQTCRHNGKPKTLSVPRLCLLGASHASSWQGKVCDEDHGGAEIARACPFWVPLQTKEEIKEEFRTLVTRNRAQVAARFPDAAALMWVLEEDFGPDLGAEDPPEEVGETAFDQEAAVKEDSKP